MKLDGDKLLADLDCRVKILFRYIDVDIENCNYGDISAKKIEIDSIRKIMHSIKIGDYKIKD